VTAFLNALCEVQHYQKTISQLEIIPSVFSFYEVQNFDLNRLF